MKTIYLSYAHADINKVERLSSRLSSAGFAVLEDNQVNPGESWEITIRRKLKDADLVVVLWTMSSVQSRYVRSEAYLAADLNKYFPILVGDADLPLAVKTFNTAKVSRSFSEPDVEQVLSLVKQRLEIEPSWRSDSKRMIQKARPDGSESILAPSEAMNSSIGEEIEYQNAEYSRPNGAKRSTVFIAHATADKPKLKPVVELLLENGFRLWIDKPQDIGLDDTHARMLAKSRIRFEGDWKEQINKAARKATKILACWSTDAIEGRREQFHYEVYMGLISEKLAQCRIDDVKEDDIGFPYNFGQIADLSKFSREKYVFEFQWMMDDMAKRKLTRFQIS